MLVYQRVSPHFIKPTSSPGPRHTKSLRKVLTCDVRNGDDQAQRGRQTVGSEEQRQNANGHSLGILSLQEIGQW